MGFKDEVEFKDWLADLLYKELGDSAEDIWGEESINRNDLFVQMKDGNEFKIGIKKVW